MSIPRNAACVLLVSTLSIAASGQQQPTASPPDAHRITLDVVVTPKSGAPVAGLQKSDFTLLDNKAARPILTFNAISGPQAPLKIVLLIDAVNADYSRLSNERQQVDAFLRANGGHLAYPTQLAVFTDTGTQVEQEFTRDGNALSAELDKADIGLREIRRDAGFWGAEDRLKLSVKALQLQISREAAEPGRKIIFWISPGWPYLAGTQDNLDVKQERQIFAEIVNFSTELRTAGITLYSIDPLGAGSGIGWELYYQTYLKGVAKPNNSQLGDLGLQVLAVQSGGLALDASNDLTGQIQHCVANLESYYELSFDAPPADRPDEYHQLDLKVDKTGLIAHTRTGYYDEP